MILIVDVIVYGNSLYNLLYITGRPCDTNEMLFSVITNVDGICFKFTQMSHF